MLGRSRGAPKQNPAAGQATRHTFLSSPCNSLKNRRKSGVIGSNGAVFILVVRDSLLLNAGPDFTGELFSPVAICSAALFVVVTITTAKYSMVSLSLTFVFRFVICLAHSRFISMLQAVNLGIWLGGMGGFLVAFFLIGYNAERYNHSWRVSDDVSFCTIFTLLNVATFGLTIGFLFAGPWLYMVDHGTARNVNADGRGADLYGIFLFNESAFVDSRFVGVSEAKSRGSVTTRYCVAPIKSSLSQVDVIYWAVAYDWYFAKSKRDSICSFAFLFFHQSALTPLFYTTVANLIARRRAGPP
jgi:hypothetical protein